MLRLPPEELPPQEEIDRAIRDISAPASANWILARVAALLLPYYERETPQAIREMEAEDWLEALDGLPKWAIEKSVRWWKGPDNPDRRKRPMEGDIASRAKTEAGNVRAVSSLAARARNVSQRYIEPPRPSRMSAERAAEIMVEAGFRPRRFEDAPE